MPKYSPKDMEEQDDGTDSADEQETTETPEQENSESPSEQEGEAQDGTEMKPQGARVPEAFQQKVDALVQTASKPMLEYLRSVVMEREHEIMKSETKPEKSYTFDTEGMPE